MIIAGTNTRTMNASVMTDTDHADRITLHVNQYVGLGLGDQDARVSMTASQARTLAKLLIEAADRLDAR